MILPKPTFSVHHLHPIFVNFTAAMIPASVGSDIVGIAAKRASLRAAGWWLMLYAAIITPLTAAAGWLWKREVEAGAPPDLLRFHQTLGIALALVFLLLAWWRSRFFLRDKPPTLPYLIVAGVVTLALVYQGTIGGQMAFGP